MNKLTKIAVCGLMIFTLTGCGEVPKLENGKDVLVSFTDKEKNIAVDDLYNILKEKYGINYLVDLIDKSILEKKYQRDETSEKQINSQVEIYESYYGGKDEFLNMLNDSGYRTIEEFKDYLFLGYQRNLALKDYVKENIKDSEIEKYYKNEIFGEITVSHILITVPNEDKLTEEEKRQNEENRTKTIEEIYAKLKEGKDFHELAKEYSKDSKSALNGGKLEPFTNGEMEDEFEKEALRLEVGKYSEKAIKTSNGFHIILKEEQKEKPKLETVKEEIIKDLTDKKIKEDNKLQYKALIELRKKEGIKINDEVLNSNYENAVNNWLYSKEK